MYLKYKTNNPQDKYIIITAKHSNTMTCHCLILILLLFNIEKLSRGLHLPL